ncbi:MAG: 4-hydroxy-tetrahydrodipicolinate synthase [Burkholderiales bacterium]|nr:4-hydroxy-tetrahydrodipicolinate synthase [Rhodocyclaceae bacterium]MCA3022734.1 4-hydroxy-tetrahydrodipicolinate synthase [Rhodocyclaceae bacterium]MCA3051513.1 4-hydroxy-tetrahydrodipicolinate synthase [Rhodocyclaceae bacterium]MCA3086817.1 4-hydroxy-tetrahydrodipicolinate synthase [Rhodocyclaceae bacterium]
MKSDVKLRGSMVAIVTPMHANGDLDFARLKALIDWHVAEGTDGIVIVGTTGESPTVDFDEHQKLIAAAVEYADKRIPVIAGTGANSTKESIFLAEAAKRVGADYSLSVVPYYNKPTQEGLYQHFKAIVGTCDLPLILYNVPGRTVADLANETVLRLAELPNIVGIKDATANMARGAELLKFAPKSFGIYSGEDVSTLALMLLGAHGTISVTANVAPRLMHELCMAALAGEREKAIVVNNRLLGLHNHLFLEANPIPVKWALQQMGRIDSGIRLPLTPFESKFHETLRASMREAGIL